MSNIEKLARYIGRKKHADQIIEHILLFGEITIQKIHQSHEKTQCIIRDISSGFDISNFDKKVG